MIHSPNHVQYAWILAWVFTATGLCGNGAKPCVPGWEPQLATWAGIEDNWIRGVTVWDDGEGESIYITGEFATIGGHVFNHVARWDGQAWQPVVGPNGIGLGGKEAQASMLIGAGFAAFDDGSGEALYVAGRVAVEGGSPIRGVARWDGTAWSLVGGTDGSGEFDGNVEALEVFDDGNGPALYAGGTFSTVEGVETGPLARWDGSEWSSMTGNIQTGGAVWTLRTLTDGVGNALYVGGQFSSAGGVAVSNIARWDGQEWSALLDQKTGAIGLSGMVRAIEAFDDGSGPAIYFGGSFLIPGTFFDRASLAFWDGTSWQFDDRLVDPSLSGGISDLMVHDDGSGPALFAGGRFAQADGRVFNHVARLVDDEWLALPGPDGVGVFNNYQTSWTQVRRFIAHDRGDGSKLHIVGTFDEAGGAFADNIARWDGNQLSALAPMGPGDISGAINAMLPFDDGTGPSLFAGGFLIAAGDQIARNAARWDGTQWHPLVGSNGNGLSSSGFGWARSLLRFDDGDGEALYFAGSFNRAGEVLVGNIARWDGTAWSAVGSGNSLGTDWPIRAIEAFDDGDGPAIYAVGASGGSMSPPLPRFERWLPGHAWEALPNPQDEELAYETAITHDDGSGTGLFIAGSRDAQAWLGRWRDDGWETIEDLNDFFDVADEGEPGGSILAMEVHDDGTGPALYVGGYFNAQSPSVARWDGSSFTPVGSGFTDDRGQPGTVRELRTIDDGSGAVLVASGEFERADGKPVTRIARWDGVSWNPLEGSNGEGLVISEARRVPLAAYDDGSGIALFAGGRVVEAGGVKSIGFAKWQGCQKAVPACPGDLNGDGVVASDDLGVLLNAFGVSSAGDINGDGATNADDLGILLSAFGRVCK